jgi:hypothetical protein
MIVIFGRRFSLSVLWILDFYPGSRILIFIHLKEKSRIPDPTTTKKE